MSDQGEAFLRHERTHSVRQKFLDLIGNVDIDDSSTVDAHEMVMMSLQILGEFEGGSLTRGEDLHHDPGILQDRQVAIHRTLRKIVGRRRDLGGDERVSGLRQHFDQSTTTRRISLVDRTQSLGCHVVDVGSLVVAAHTVNVQEVA